MYEWIETKRRIGNADKQSPLDKCAGHKRWGREELFSEEEQKERE